MVSQVQILYRLDFYIKYVVQSVERSAETMLQVRVLSYLKESVSHALVEKSKVHETERLEGFMSDYMSTIMKCGDVLGRFKSCTFYFC